MCKLKIQQAMNNPQDHDDDNLRGVKWRMENSRHEMSESANKGSGWSVVFSLSPLGPASHCFTNTQKNLVWLATHRPDLSFALGMWLFS